MGISIVKVLFIGNSHTYMNAMPRMLLSLVEADNSGLELIVDQSTGKGVSLEWHWNRLPTREMIAARQWDYVVLQDRSGGPLEAPESFQHHAGLLDKEIRKLGAKTIFYMTWANRHRPETQAIIADAYAKVAKRLNAHLAPVGNAWGNVRRMNPGLNLYHEDGRHANPAGSYLTACIFYSILFETTPAGLPGTLRAEGNKLVELNENQALFLQKVASESVTT